MGVPVIALEGDRFAGRMGKSILSRIGLEDLVASTPEAYRDIAARLVGNPDRLRAMRTDLRSRMAQSSLCDGATFCKDMETLFRDTWRRWCEQRA